MNARNDAPRYWNSWVAGAALGAVLFLSFLLTGNGLGSSGGLHHLLTWAIDLVAPQHVDRTPYRAKMAGLDRDPLHHWLVWMVAGVLAGGLLSGWFNGRLKVETRRGPRVGVRARWFWAFVGGLLMAYGARMARGCTSGQALSGGAVLSAGSWAFMFAVFGGAYLLAWFVRRLWTGGNDHASA